MNTTSEQATPRHEALCEQPVSDRRTSRRGILGTALKAAAVGAAGLAGAELVKPQAARAASDNQFTAFGPAAIGFWTNSSSITIGASIKGTSQGVVGVCGANGAMGFLGGNDPVFNQHAGVFGESDNSGVFGNATSPTGTGTFGYCNGSGFGVRGETSGAAGGTGVRGKNFTTGALGFLAGEDPVFNQHAGVFGESDNSGVFGNATSPTGTGTFGYCNGSGFGVRGETSGAAGGTGVRGKNFATGALGFLAGEDPVFSQHAGVYGESDQQGVFGHSTSTTGTGVYGHANGGGFAIRGETSGTPSAIGVQGKNFTSGALGFLAGEDPVFSQHAGVYGESDQQGVVGRTTSATGRGGMFLGGASGAAVRLLPSTAATHPVSGLTGDLFVDAVHRLWYCYGGASWKQLA